MVLERAQIRVRRSEMTPSSAKGAADKRSGAFHLRESKVQADATPHLTGEDVSAHVFIADLSAIQRFPA